MSWTEWIAPTTLTLQESDDPAVDAVILHKQESDGFVEVSYAQQTASGPVVLDGKKVASEILAQQALVVMRASGAMPAGCSLKKVFKNGRADVAFEPARYDRFTLSYTKAIVGEEPESFLKSLVAARLLIKGSCVEPAKSGRAKCRACKEKIAKDALRIGVKVIDPASDLETMKWYHLECVELECG